MTQERIQNQLLPLITADFPGIGGEIKAEPAHFIVEEIPLYEPVGVGEHIYVRLTRAGWTTRALQQRLARLFHLREVDIGYAGLKDKQARVTQTFSLHLYDTDEETVACRIQETLPVEVVWVQRHQNKLKRGHLLGNRFHILVLGVEAEGMARAEVIAQTIQTRGIPNYYGAQRFGMQGDNAQHGWEILCGRGPSAPWQRRFFLSAYQAALFNTWLAARIRQGWFAQLLTGDIAKKLDTGGLFLVTNAASELSRFLQREITYTGPLYGTRMRWASGKPGELERMIFEKAGITPAMLTQVRLAGSRRPARLFLSDLRIERHPDGLLFTFTLPKGAYATALLREFIKGEITLASALVIDEDTGATHSPD
jgi:tRNA pseudouridine13 synthase